LHKVIVVALAACLGLAPPLFAQSAPVADAAPAESAPSRPLTLDDLWTDRSGRPADSPY